MVGEVRLDNPWLRRLVRDRAAIPFDLDLLPPGRAAGRRATATGFSTASRWVTCASELPAREVRQLLYAIWRRAYRVRWPLERAGFRAMLGELEGRATVGAHPAVAG